MGLFPDRFLRFLQAGLGHRDLGNQVHEILGRAMTPRDSFRIFEDFNQKPGSTLPGFLTTQDTSSAGTPTLDYGTDLAAGCYVMQLDPTNEAETVTLYGGDNHVIDITKTPKVEWRVKLSPDVTGAGGALAAGDKIVIGIASDRNATLDTIATNAWFRLEGANANILVETDDNSTNTDDKDTGSDWVADTWYRFAIDFTDLTDVRFLIDDIDVTPTTMSMSHATGTVSPYIELQKAAAANFDHKLTIDYLDVVAAR